MSKKVYVPSGAKIKVIGCGGAGSNAVTRMVRDNIQGVEFIAVNTDAQHLAITEAATRIQIGERCTGGLGAGGNHTMGKAAAEESLSELKENIIGADMVFVTAGMGGGTGTGSAPVVAKIAKESGALTIAVCTKPFCFEGAHRMQTAEEGINNIVDSVDTLIIIPNDRLLDMVDQKTGVDGAFKLADEVLCNGVKAIAEVITVPGIINLDFADVKAVMKDAGPAWMSIGKGAGQNRAADAARAALASPLLDIAVDGAMGVIYNVCGGEDLSLMEVNSAADVIRQAVDPQANIIFGVSTDPRMGKEVQITLIATGFATKESMLSNNHEKEMTRMMKGLRSKTQEELEVPSFMRYRSAQPSIRKPAPAAHQAPPRFLSR